MSETSVKVKRPGRGKHVPAAVRRMLKVLKSGGDLRARKIRRVRGAVRAKRYENDLKLTIAMERLAREL